jgi:glutamate racemase
MGDNLNAPYGVRDTSNIFDLTTKCIERMWEEDCDLVILACNTASAAALKQIQEEWLPKNKRVLGVFVPLIESLTKQKLGR